MTNTVAGVLLNGSNARPSASSVSAGTLYADSVNRLVYQSDGTNWNLWASLSRAGLELDYTQITASVTITSTSRVSPTTIITGGAVTYDGYTTVLVTFYCDVLYTPSTTSEMDVTLYLYDGSTDIGSIADVRHPVSGSAGRAGAPVMASRRITPTAGSHTFAVKGASPSGATGGIVDAGTGTSSDSTPAFLRVTRV